ncbi:MAG: pantoate--beta-alanine ligase [Omnitrophica bacterium RIFCSPHIGHO2_02_FULL_46_11]|nr:MAG: pantoate--beta-alanine ligase [Omnitrophica bacterium RIFCSPHIGHO2_02_FULL_46_11]OGW87691.1 MAG: pantoate--beta-alanine ligase [Omnitrophica bacterium RIFCSPLOWO2_01_FULL_45_10b]
MKIIRSIKKLDQALLVLRQKGKRIGFVPTMGCLHEGHLSLVRYAQRENDVVVVSIFVNLTQFGPREDFKRYPRDLKQDQKFLKKAGVDYLFVPLRTSIYPKNFKNFIEPGPLARHLCGPKRPGHFRGVATVVHRLFKLVKPNVAYFGEKDYQQARIIAELVRRLRLPVKIRTCPIVREKDGLAMSSRNQYLSKKERICARAIYQSLKQAKKLIHSGERNILRIKRAIREILASCVDKIDYIEVANPKTCAPVKTIRNTALIAIACYVGSTRLIDNFLVKL